ncbi:MAG TPA: hypothetical protein VFM15_01530 [Gammaproteobacteria bacterium]|nr:hypothetical protein [Gammaproteobacteria bacterium]
MESPVMSYAQRLLITAGVSLAILVPFFVAGFLTTVGATKRTPKPLPLFVALFVLELLLTWSFKLVLFIPSWGGWNWQGKILEIAWPLLLVALVPTISAESIGLKLPAEFRRWRELLIVCLLYAAIFIPFMLYMMHGQLHFGTTLPTYVFQLTLPGLGEELVYRGVLLMLLNRIFGRPWRFAGIQFGWGFVIIRPCLACCMA